MPLVDPGKVFGRGISFPPRVGADGRLVWSEGEANVRESIRIILLTEPQERLRVSSTFGSGLRRFLFEPNNAATRTRIARTIEQAIAAWESRVRVDSVTVEADPEDAESAIATITYRLVATQVQERVSLSVKLAG
ncbi:MAG TPA: GPW/gp25 family protein [bacterium]